MSAQSPYRAASDIARTAAAASDEIAVRASDLESHRGAIQALWKSVLVGSVPAIALGAVGGEVVGLSLAAIAFGVGIWRWRTAADVEGVVIRVDGDELIVRRGARARRGEPLARAALDDLDDVTFDTKTIAKLRRDTSLASVTLGTRVDADVDVARVMLVLEGYDQPIALTESYVSHTEAVDIAGRVRRFLRARGWRPRDERATSGAIA